MNNDPQPRPVYKGYSYDRRGCLTSVVEFPLEPAPGASSRSDHGPSPTATVTDSSSAESIPGDDSRPEARVTVYDYDRAGRLVSVEHLTREQWRRRQWERDPKQRLN